MSGATCVSKSHFNGFLYEAIYLWFVNPARGCVYRSFSVCFHHKAPAVKGLPVRLSWLRRRLLLRSAALWTLWERHWSFRPVSPCWNIMYVYLWREFILLIHWLALLQRLKEFDFLFIYSLHFPSCGRVVSRVIPRENFLPPCHSPLWNEIRERKTTRDRGQGT